VAVNEGGCPDTPSSTPSDYPCFVSSSGDSCTIDGKLTDLADGEHTLIMVESTSKWACTAIDNIVNGPYDYKMVDPEPLEAYGISVREVDEAGTLTAYVPLNVVPDDTGGGKAAFSARMIYWPTRNATWQEAQSVRVVWLVQMLTDACDDSGFVPSDEAEEDSTVYTEEWEDWCASNRTSDQVQIVHIYDEEWFVTGMAVREDHGLDVAIAYEDPATDDDVYTEDALWQLGWGLGNTFVLGRDCDDDNAGNDPDYDAGTQTCHWDGVRDIAIQSDNGNSTIGGRFDRLSNSGVSEEERWAIPQDALRVETLPTYDHQDYATYIAMTETPGILDQFSQDTTPTLLFAREEHYRSAGLDAGSWADQVLSIDISPAEEETIAAVQWSPYRYEDGAWESYPIADYWDQMEVKLTEQFNLLFPDDDEYTNDGRVVVARSFYISLVQGLVGQVESGLGTLWTTDLSEEYSDPYLASGLKSAGKGSIAIAKEIAKVTILHMKYPDMAITYWENVDWDTGLRWTSASVDEVQESLFSSLGRAAKEFFVTPWTTLIEGLGKTKTAVIGGAAALGAVVAIGISIYAASTSSGWSVVTNVMLGLATLMAIHGVISAIAGAVSAATKAGTSVLQAMNATASQAFNGIKSAFKGVAVIGLIIGVVATWAAFGIQAGLSGGMSRVEWGYAIAGAIASTIVVVILFVIQAIPIIGPIITAVLGLIDVAVTLLCSAFLSDEEQMSETATWLCSGISGIATNILKFFIFSSNIMVDLQPEDYDRLEFADFDADDFVYPDLGFSEGNLIMYGVTLTNTIRMIRIPSNMGAIYAAQYTNDRLRSSTFEYELQSEETDFHDTLSRGMMEDEWLPVDGESALISQPFARDRFYITQTLQADSGLPLPEPGINQPAEVYISEAYAVPLQECYVGVCTIQTEKATEHYDLGEGLKFDIFPTTLDEFYELAPKSGGYSLAWGQEGSKTFPRQVDADGDGLPYEANDNLWDADYDNLSDWYEAQTGSDPTDKDSDGDGLTDHQEARLGTNPTRTDSDGDGLIDCQETFHQVLVADDYGRCGAVGTWSGGWEFVYDTADDGTPLTMWVTSDPLSADADADELTDFQEKTFGFHPRWPSQSTVLTLESEIKEVAAGGAHTASDGFVAPGDTIYYEATVENELENRYAQGLLTTDFPLEVDDDDVPPQSFVLYPQEEQTISGDAVVDDDIAATETYSLTQVAGALITDWSELAGEDVQLWLPFEDPITLDQSGNIPSHDGTCVGTCTGQSGVYGDALRLTGSNYMASDYDPSESAYGLSLWFKTSQADGTLFSVDYWYGLHVYLQSGEVCAYVRYFGQGGETICSDDTYNDGEWHHVVHTFGSPVGTQKLYVDGLKESGSRTGEIMGAEYTISIGHSEGYSTANLNGWIDDVRVFDTGLDEARVQALFNQPVFDLKFDEDYGWVDHSAFGNDGSCDAPYWYGYRAVDACPSRVSGVSGLAGRFSGDDHISIPADPSLNLHDSSLTIAAWINPDSSYPDNCVQTYYNTCALIQPQGILGQDSGQPGAYPTLQRAGCKIRFGFGTASTMLYYTSGDVLTQDAWNHVVVTFDDDSDTMDLYVNGELKGHDDTTFDGTSPPPVSSFTIGRTSDKAEIDFGSVLVTAEHDPGDAELCMAVDGTEIFNQSVVDDYDPDDDGYREPYSIDFSQTFEESLSLVIWENDSNPRCGTAPNGSDQHIATWSFYTTDSTTHWEPGYIQTYDSKSFTGDVEGSVSYLYENDSIPFYGKIDEVQIYKQALNADSVDALYQASVTALYLKLDDPPGETSFADAVDPQRQATCSGDACPTAGVGGRVNQATWFESADDDVLTIANSDVNQLTNDLTVAAWVKPSSVSGVQRVVAAARTQSRNGYGFGINGSNLRFTTFNVRNYDLTGIGLQADEWVHIAAVMDSQNDVSFYVNGTFAGKVDHSAPGTADTDDDLLIGATTVSGSSTLTEQFDGSIDDVFIFRKALSADEIADLYARAPVFQLHLEEDKDATQFADDSGNGNDGICTGDRCPLAGLAVEGRIGRAADFDGLDDRIQVSDDSSLDLETFSVGAWVKPTKVSGYYPQELVGKYGGTVSQKTDVNYRLYIKSNSLTPAIEFGQDCDTYKATATSSADLVMNQWNHVMGTFDGKYLTIYVNGIKAGQWAYYYDEITPCTNSRSLRIGGYASTLYSRLDGFSGRLDEVTVYASALSAFDVEDIFLYQGGWVEDSQSHDITVDADDPHSEVRVPATYLPLQDTQLLATAWDPTSGIAGLELGARRYGTSYYAWTDASRCQDAIGDGVWCPTFDPPAEGLYYLRVRATDLVGQRARSDDTVSVYVDDYAPSVGFSFAAGERIDASPHPTRPNAWTIHLSGMVIDESLPGGFAGSGVATETIKVKLYNSDGTLAGQQTQLTISGQNWSVDYLLDEAQPTGVYTLAVEAADQITLLPTISEAQIARHTTIAERAIQVDATAPLVTLDLASAPATILNGDITLSGLVSEHPVPVQVDWESDDGGDLGVSIRCDGTTLYSVEPGTFPTGTISYSWTGDVPRNAACRVRLKDSAGSGHASGAIYVCGSPVVASWSVNWSTGGSRTRTVDFAADSAACGPDVEAAGVAWAEIAFTPILPGSPFHNETLDSGQVLYLPMDDTPDASGTLRFRDVSGHRHNGTCSGTYCPIAGEPGHLASAAWFDWGDFVEIRSKGSSDFDFGTGPFGVSLWYKSNVRSISSSWFRLLKLSTAGSDAFDLYVTPDDNRLAVYHGSSSITGGPISLRDWHHIAVTRDDSGNLTIYVDGSATASGVMSGYISGVGWTTLGAAPGWMDDVRIYDRALSPGDVRTLYLGSEVMKPSLLLPLDEAWAVDSTKLEETSGAGHQAILYTGDGDNKAVFGRVGAYAFGFDGADDYVGISPDASLDLSEGSFTQAAWVYPAPSDSGVYPILSSGAYHEPHNHYPFLNVVNRTQLQVGFGDGSTLNTFTSGDILTQQAWNYVVTTFDGTTYRIYVNGVERAATTLFAGLFPAPTQQFDLGRGTDTGSTSTCAALTELRLRPVGSYSGKLYRVKFAGDPVYTSTPSILNPGQTYVVDQQVRDFCGSAEVEVEYGVGQQYGIDWHSMGTYTLDARPGSGSHSFSSTTVEAILQWDVSADPSDFLYFRGRLDDVRVYPRVLSLLEIQALHKAAWRTATLSETGTDDATWTYPVPAGLEGTFRIDLRGWDTAGNFAISSYDPWQGDIDTLDPRVSLTYTTNISAHHFSAIAQDFNLAEDGFSSPCGAGEITKRQYFQSPWYQAISGQDRLYQLTAECELPFSEMHGEIDALDTPGLARSVAISGSYAYVADGVAGLQIVDISDPGALALAGGYDTPGIAYAVAVAKYPPDPVVSLAAPAALLGENDVPIPTRADANETLAPTADVDLTVESIAAEPAALSKNQSFVVTVTVKNQGSENLVGSFHAGAYADFEPGSCNNCSGSFGCTLMVDLAAGATKAVTFTHSGFAMPGSHTIYAQVDSYCMILDDTNPDNNTAGPEMVVVDVFTVTATVPPGNGAIIARDGVISATLSEPVNGNSLTPNAFAVRGSQTGIYAGSYGLDAAWFDATNDFKPGEEIVVNLSDGILSLDGSVLVPYAWQFRAEAPRGTGIFTDSGQRLGVEATRGLALADLDGDGDLDAFFGNWVDPSQVWLNQGGAGIFTDSLQSLNATEVTDVALGDLDGDGDLDAFIGNSDIYGGGANQVWLNQGGAQLGTPGVFTDTTQSLGISNTQSIALGDLDGDGDLDAFAGNAAELYFDAGCPPGGCYGRGGSKVWLNGGSGTFVDSGQILSETMNTNAVALGDLDGDGDLDAFVGNSAWWSSVWGRWVGGESGVWLNDGGLQEGVLGTFSDSGQRLGFAPTVAVALGDLDSDGDLDALLGNNGQDNTVWLNDGSGAFTDSGQSLGSSTTNDVALGDLDGDGDLDAFIGTRSANTVWLNDGSGAFTDSGQGLIDATDTNGVALGDVDGDGDLDAVTGNDADPTGPNFLWINNANAPAPVDDSFFVLENSSGNVLDVLGNDSDPDGDSLTVVAVGTMANGTTATNGSTVTFTPTQYYSGTVVFTYTVSDPGDLTGTATVTVTVGGVNDAPVAQDDTAVTNEDVAVSIDALDNDSDPDGQTPFVSAVGAPSNGSAAIVGGDVVYTPAPDFNGSNVFTYTISDGTLTDTATITVTVAAVNDAPSFTKGADQAVSEDAGAQTVLGWATGLQPGPATAVDESGQALTFVVANDNNALFSTQPTLDGAGNLSFTPAADAYGSAVVTVRLQDDGGTANGGSDTSPPQTFNITISPVNDPPTLNPIGDRAVDEDAGQQTVLLTGIGTGAANETQTLTVTASSSNPSLIPTPAISYTSPNASGVLQFTPVADQFGSATITVSVTDGLSQTVCIFQVTVDAINDPPTLDPIANRVLDRDAGPQTVALTGVGTGAANETQTLAIMASSSDPSLIPEPAVAYASPSVTGTLAFTPTTIGIGQATIVVTVTDGLSQTVRSFQVMVNPRGTLAYIASGAGGLQIVDVSDPAAPQLMGQHQWHWGDPYTWHEAYDVAVAEDYAYLATGRSGMMVIDISDPTDPQPAGHLDTDGYARGIAISGTYAYVADGRSGLAVINITDPTSPQSAGIVDTDYAYNVALYGNHAYVANAISLQVVDISNPNAPQIVGETPQAHSVDVAIAPTATPGEIHVYSANRFRGLQVVDVSDPTDPQPIATFNTPDYARGVAAGAGYVYVADSASGLRVVNPDGTLPQATACDAAGNCATVEITLDLATDRLLAKADALQAQAASLDITILDVPPILESTDPISVTGLAYTTISSLHALTVTVNGALIHADAWASGAITETIWATDWTPPGEGQQVFQATITAWDGAAASDTFTTTVDTQPPQVILASTLLTGTHYYEPRIVDLTGWVSDTTGAASVQVTILATGDVLNAAIDGSRWTAPWQLSAGSLPDGDTYTVTVRAADIVGHEAIVTETVVVDVMGPAPVTLDVSSGGVSLAQGDIVRTLSPTLTLSWSASSDGSGLDDYLVEWTVQTTGTLASTLTAHDPLTRTAQYGASDGQKMRVQVASQDVHGHQTWQDFGPIYVDSPHTPDYAILTDIDGTYYGWMESGCTLLGVDRRAARYALPRAALNDDQAFYATWDSEALRLAWSGANWNVSGDLFIYLDTTTGGVTTTLSPYLSTMTNTVISLPDGMAADTVIWVQDAATALLLRWDGSDWMASLLPENHYQFDPALNNGQVNLYLPFDLIGLTAGGSLDIVAFATEEGALRLWATMPAANPVNSRLSTKSTLYATEIQTFALIHHYHWDSVGAGVCPNGSDGTTPAYLDADVQVRLSTDPAGTAYCLLGDNLFWMQDALLNTPPADVTSLLSFLSTDHPPVGNGQAITYTIHFRNLGAFTATNVTADVTAQYALRLPDDPGGDHLVVALGDIGPGEEGTVTFLGVVDTGESSEPWAAVQVHVYDDAHPSSGQPLEWMWAHHQVDRVAPEFLGLQQPTYYIGTDTVALRGYAYDDADVPQITVTIEPPTGPTDTLVCPDSTPADGGWSCAWDVSASNGDVTPADGDVFNLQIQASDGFGQSAGNAPLAFVVDARPPTVTLNVSATQVFSGSLLHSSSLKLVGDVADEGGVSAVSVCVDDVCGPASLQLTSGQSSVTYDDVPAAPISIDGGTACGGGEIVYTFHVTHSFEIAHVSVGFAAEHDHRDDLLARLQSPAGTTVQVIDDDGITGTEYRNYDVFLNDAAPIALAATGDHDPSAPRYDRYTRPDQPLQAFQGEGAAGDWTLSICDTNPATDDGAYLGSRLVLMPRDTAAKSGRWAYQTPNIGALDHVSQTITVRGQDVVGNCTVDPLSLVVWVDNVAPVISVTGVLSESILLGEATTIVSGTVSDGSPVTRVFVHIQLPDGTIYRKTAARDGDRWWFDLQPLFEGQYTMWVNASDKAGNTTTVGPFDVKVQAPLMHTVYLPLVLGEGGVSAPDLVVDQIAIANDEIQVVIRNQGNAPVTDSFWVDLYINPDPIPTHVNQTWNDLASQGAVWGITVDIQPGDVLVLRTSTSDPYYWPEYSSIHWPLWEGTQVWVQVDSANIDTTYGGVLETHELAGNAYNNVMGRLFEITRIAP